MWFRYEFSELQCFNDWTCDSLKVTSFIATFGRTDLAIMNRLDVFFILLTLSAAQGTVMIKTLNYKISITFNDVIKALSGVVLVNKW